MNAPNVVVIQAWPAAMDRSTAAAYLKVSDSHFQTLVKLYPERLRAWNLLPGGDARWNIEDLDAYRLWRATKGVEKKQERARRAG